MWKQAALVVAILTLAGVSGAETHEIRMLSSIERDGQLEFMVFDPPFLKVEVGDTVRFLPTEPGHSVQSSFVPEGGPTWASNFDETIEIVLDTPGVYLYRCDPHRMVGMLGVLQVGEATNFDAASAAASELVADIPLNGDRYERYLDQVER